MEYVAPVIVLMVMLAVLALYAVWARRIEKRVGPPSEPPGEPGKRFGLFTIFGNDTPNIPPGAM